MSRLLWQWLWLTGLLVAGSADSLAVVIDLDPGSNPTSSTTEPTASKITMDEWADQLQQAVALARFGLFDDAEALCQRLLQQNPDSERVRRVLNDLKEQRGRAEAQDPAAGLARRLRETILPEITLKDMEPRDAIELLKTETARLSTDKKPIPFTWQMPSETKLPRITLNLRSVSVRDALRRITEATGLHYRVEPQAVVVYQEPDPRIFPFAPSTAVPNAKP